MSINCSNTDFGNTLRDNVLKFQLDNEVANNLTVTVSGTQVTLSLTSKTGANLGGGTFDLAGGLGISSVVLDNDGEKLVFTFANGSKKYCDLAELYAEIPTKTSDITNDGDGTSPFATQSYVNTYGGKIDKIYLNNVEQTITNKEVHLTAYQKPDTGIPKTDLANDVQTSLGKADTALQSVPNTYRTSADQDIIDATKVDKVEGKGLSTEDFTTELKTKLNGIETGAEVNKIDTVKLNGTALPIENKTVDITIPDQLDTNVKLSSRLVTYYNIGAITGASGTSPVELGQAGDSIRQVLNKITQMEEIQPSKTDPSITSVTLSSSASDEVGTSISSINYSIVTNQGSYQFGPATGVTWSNFNFGSGIDKTTTTGTIDLATPYIVGTSSALNYTCTGTHSDGVVAKTNLGNDSDPEVKIIGGDKTKATSFSKTSKVYAYTNVTSSTTTPTTGSTKRSEVNTFKTNGETLSYSAGDYIYFFTDGANRTVQTNVLGQWADIETTRLGAVTITLANGSQYSLQGYRIGPFGASGSDKYRV